MLRLDDRTHVLVSPQNATPEYMDKLRQRYKIKYDIPAKGGKKKIKLIINNRKEQYYGITRRTNFSISNQEEH